MVSPLSRTTEQRSGDRVRNTMFIGSLSLTTISIILSPYINAWITEQTRRGIRFEDPEAWKDAVVQILGSLLLGVWGVVYMWFVRWADKTEEPAPTPVPVPSGATAARVQQLEALLKQMQEREASQAAPPHSIPVRTGSTLSGIGGLNLRPINEPWPRGDAPISPKE